MNSDKKESLSFLLMKNTLWNIWGKLFLSFSGLFLTYYTVKKIGLENYGIYALITAAGGYISMLDLGAGSAFVKYVSEYKALGLVKKINSLLAAGLLFYACFSITVLALIFFFGDYALSWLNIPASMRKQAYTILIIYGLTLSLSGIFSPYQAAVSGLERFDIIAKVNIFLSALNLISSIIVLERGYGLTGLMANNLVMTFISGSFFAYFSRSLLPELSVNPLLAEREMFGKIFFYGSKIQITRLSSIVSSHFEKFIITRAAGISFVALYQIGNSLCEQARNLPLLITSALFPAFSRLWADGRKNDIRETYFRAVKYLSFIAVPAMSFLAISSKSVILLWMGNGYDSAANVASALAIGYMVSTIMGAVGASAVQGIGKPEIQMRGAIFNMTLNIALSLILIKIFGFPGAAFGTSIAMIAAVFYFIYVFHPLIEADNRIFLVLLFRFAAAAVSACAAVAFFSYFQKKPALRMDAFIDILKNGFIFVSVYIGFLFIFKPFDSYDRKFFNKSGIFFIKFMRIFCRNERNV